MYRVKYKRQLIILHANFNENIFIQSKQSSSYGLAQGLVSKLKPFINNMLVKVVDDNILYIFMLTNYILSWLTDLRL